MGDLFPPLDYSIDEQVAEVERELHLREELYPKWVLARKMTQSRADRQIGLMRAVLVNMKRLKEMGHG